MQPDNAVEAAGDRAPRVNGDRPPATYAPGRSPEFASTFALTAVLALAAFALVMALVMSVVKPVPVPGGFSSARQGAETALYVTAYAVLLPAALWAGPWIARRVVSRANAGALPVLAAMSVASLAGALVLVRLSGAFSWGGGFSALLVAMGGWWLAAAATLARATSRRPWARLLALSPRTDSLWIAAAFLLFCAALTTNQLGSVDPVPLVAGAVIIALTLRLFASGWQRPRIGRGWSAAADVGLVILLALTIPDLVIVSPEDPGPSFLESVRTPTISFHQDFLLGPANQVLGGGAMLVDTSSQYGVGSIYFLAAWFKVLPIGYGTLGLLDGVLTATYFIAGFLLLRISGVSRLLAGSALALGVVALVYNREYPVGSIVQEGPLRFGLPLLVVLALTAAVRWPRRRVVLRAVALAVLGVSSIWSLEMFAYTAATFASILLFEALLLPGDRLRWLLREAALCAAVCVSAHLLFAGATVIGSGSLPEWGQYLVYLEAFLFSELGDITYDFAFWSPGLAVGAGYLASACALGLAVRFRPGWIESDRVALVGLAGATAYGVLFLSYFVDRSAPHILVYVCLPLLLAATLWLSLLLRSQREPKPSGVAIGALAFALCLGLVTVMDAWPRILPRFENAPVAYAVPGVKSARGAFARLTDFPRFDARSVAGESLLERFMPSERRSVVLIRPGLDIETLMHAGRANALPLPNAIQYMFVGGAKFPLLREAAARLEPGQRMLVDEAQLVGLENLKRDPASAGSLTKVPPIGSPTTPLQQRTLAEIDKRFRLRRLYTGDGYVVVELVGRRAKAQT